MTHIEIDQKISQLWNDAPIKWAFGDRQAKQMFREWELDYNNPEDVRKIVRLTNGGYCLRTDLPKIKEISEECARLRKELADNKNEFAKAVYNAFGNYECMWTHDPWNAIKSLEFEDTEENKDIIRKQWKKLCKKYGFPYQDPFTISDFGY